MPALVQQWVRQLVTLLLPDKLTTTQQARINNNDMIFAHAGKPVVANYTDRGTYATVELNERCQC